MTSLAKAGSRVKSNRLTSHRKPALATRSKHLQSSLIGQRLIESGLLDQDQLKEALATQRDTGLLLGEICLLKGWFDYPRLKACLPRMRSRLGEQLLSLGYITVEQLWLALLEQRQTGEKLGEILIVRGWVDRTVLDKVVCARHES
jgi:hypothetical protein